MTKIADMPPHRPGDRRGLLVFDGILPEPYQSREDSTLDLDYRARVLLRPATGTERALLAHLGYDLPADLKTHVRPGPVRVRTWPTLADQTPHTNEG